jgi:hypothetical protein
MTLRAFSYDVVTRLVKHPLCQNRGWQLPLHHSDIVVFQMIGMSAPKSEVCETDNANRGRAALMVHSGIQGKLSLAV